MSALAFICSTVNKGILAIISKSPLSHKDTKFNKKINLLLFQETMQFDIYAEGIPMGKSALVKLITSLL